MKKLILSLLALLGVAAFFASCEKEPIIPNPVGQPVINVSQSLSNDGIVTIKWEAKNATLVTCNEVDVLLAGSVSFPASDSTLVFVAKNEKFEATKQIQVNKPAEPEMVIDPVPTLLAYQHSGYEKVVFNLHLTNVTKIDCNGDVRQVIGGTYTLTVDPNNFTDTATYILTAIGDGGQVSQTIKIALGRPTAIQLLEKAVSNGGCVWHPCYAESDLSGIRRADIPVSTIDRQFLLTPSPRHLIYAYDGGYVGGITNDVAWNLNAADSTFSVGSNTEQYKIESINLTELIIRTKIMYDGQTHFLWDYYHPQ